MLTFDKKRTIFEDLINKEEISYADSFNGEIKITAENWNYYFLHQLESEDSICIWLDKLKSRIVMKEDDAFCVEDIINDYIELG